MRQQRETLHLLIVCQLLLQGIDTFLHHLHDLRIGAKLLTVFKSNTVLTGISFAPDQVGVMGYDAEKNEYFSYFHPRLNASFNGTGDLFASTLTGAYVRGCSLLESLTIAADFTAQCVELTLQNPNHVFYGVEFERALPSLVKRLGL